MRERVGESTSETNVVAERSPIVGTTFSTGLIKDSISSGMKRSISLFEINAVAFSSVARADFLTSALVSQIASDRTGMMSGKPEQSEMEQKQWADQERHASRS